MLARLAAMTWLSNLLYRCSYSFGAGCADSLLIWGSVRRFRVFFERIDFQILLPPPPSQVAKRQTNWSQAIKSPTSRPQQPTSPSQAAKQSSAPTEPSSKSAKQSSDPTEPSRQISQSTNQPETRASRQPGQNKGNQATNPKQAGKNATNTKQAGKNATSPKQAGATSPNQAGCDRELSGCDRGLSGCDRGFSGCDRGVLAAHAWTF